MEIISVCNKTPKIKTDYVETIKIDVLDRPNECLIDYFDSMSDKINEIKEKNMICLVHCIAGISRSSTIVLAYLMKYLKLNLKEAHLFLKSKRPLIRPNLGIIYNIHINTPKTAIFYSRPSIKNNRYDTLKLHRYVSNTWLAYRITILV